MSDHSEFHSEDNHSDTSYQIAKEDENKVDSNALPPVTGPPSPSQLPFADKELSKKSDEWWRDRKFVLELAGFIVLTIYTGFTGLQWLQIRWTNHLTREALNGSNSAIQQTLDKMTWQIKETHEIAKQTLTQAQQTTKISTDTHTLALQAVTQANAAVTSANTARKQLSLTQKQFETSQRPWISVPSASTILYKWPEHYDLNLEPKINISNVGNLPAYEVHVVEEFFFVEKTEQNFLEVVKKKQVDFCKEQIRAGTYPQTTGNAQVIYPGKSSEYARTGLGQSLTISQIDRNGYVAPVLIGCVLYKFASSSTVHQSGFIFIVARKNSQFTGIGLYPDQDVPLTEIVLQDAYNGDSYND